MDLPKLTDVNTITWRGCLMRSPKDPDVPIDPTWKTRIALTDDAHLLRAQMASGSYCLAQCPVIWHGQVWFILDGHAEGSGVLLMLVSPDYALLAAFVLPSECRLHADHPIQNHITRGKIQ